MTIREAIKAADELRDNAISDEQKFLWLSALDGEVAETTGDEIPENTFPEDRELLMPHPHDGIYIYYICAMIDFYNGETTLYANDTVVFNSAMDNARAWWIRNHKPSRKGFKVM